MRASQQLQPACVLCTAAGGLGWRPVLQRLSSIEERRVRVICCDTRDDVLVSRWFDYRRVPPADDSRYVDALLELCRKEAVDVVLPGHTSELLPLAENVELFRDCGTSVAVSSAWSVRTAIYKDECYNFLAEAGLGAPSFKIATTAEEFRHAAEELGYPEKTICFKPARHLSGGARGFRVLTAGIDRARLLFRERLGHPFASYEEVMATLAASDSFPPLIVSEYLPGDEYSVYLFCRDGSVLYCVPHLREELQLFYSFTASIVEHSEIECLCRRIASAFHFSHNVNIQVKMSEEGVPKVVEINPRIAGTIVLPMAGGLNFPYWSVRMALGEAVPEDLPVPYGLRMHRYWGSLFVPPDGGKAFEL